MITCLEGPSAVGKTTTCSALAEQMDAYNVPEVNALFVRPPDAPTNWYLERQVERWEIARKHSINDRLVILDGDVFQPLWYNWAYQFASYQDLDALSEFFRPQIEAGLLRFPDCYVCLFAHESELKQRKEADQTRTRRNFESHLRLMQVQSRYFDAMSRLAPDMVHLVEAESVEANLQSIGNIIARPTSSSVDALNLFDGLIGWLRSNEP